MFSLDKRNLSEKEIDKMLIIASKLKKLTEEKSLEWVEYVRLLDDYCVSLLEYKKNFNFSIASDEQINQIKYYDRDIWLINNFIKKIPSMFIKNLDIKLKEIREKEKDEQYK